MKKSNMIFVLMLVVSSVFYLAGCNLQEAQKEQKQNFVPQTVNEPVNEVISDVAYIDYSEDLYNKYLGQMPMAIFFYAGWCPTCRTVEEDIKSNLSTYPKGSKMLKADYDTETTLKQKYGITSQSTIVFLDEKGEVSAILAAPSSDEIKEAIIDSMK